MWPPPITTKRSRAARRAGSGSASATSNRLVTRLRSRNASTMLLQVRACSAAAEPPAEDEDALSLTRLRGPANRRPAGPCFCDHQSGRAAEQEAGGDAAKSWLHGVVSFSLLPTTPRRPVHSPATAVPADAPAS